MLMHILRQAVKKRREVLIAHGMEKPAAFQRVQASEAATAAASSL